MRGAGRHLTFREARCLPSFHGRYNERIDISTMYERIDSLLFFKKPINVKNLIEPLVVLDAPGPLV